MLKNRVQATLKKLRSVFRKKSRLGACTEASTEATLSDVARSEPAEKSVDVTRSSSTQSSAKSETKTSMPAVVGDVSECKEGPRLGSFEGSIEKASSHARISESPSVTQAMPQLPTIVVGEDLDPIDLGPRRDSEQLPREEYNIEHSGYAT
ncbi:hypothetical protein APHAL10511_006657 [Amanita phalloides]|nr:hypothetical protein APHAL10511_006657 [Amanita phalloides]